MAVAFKFLIAWQAALGAAVVTGCGAFGDDSERYEDLDRLRVLAVRAEPADLIVGETATLSALVFEPKDRDVRYEWSWCPSRADAAENFECNITEAELARVWEDQDLPGAPPSYDLGSEPEASFTHLLTPELVSAFCQNLVGDNELPELQLACLEGLKASVKLTVRSAGARVTTLKSLSLLMNDVNESERNTNPELDFALGASELANDRAVAASAALRAGKSYKLTADLDDATAQTFTPPPIPGNDSEQDDRLETLVASWFVSVGELVDPELEDGFGGDPRTTFVDGHNDFEALLEQGWKLPLTAKSDALMYVVVRDERGGVGWAKRTFGVKGGK
jgi:hypothetical protein